ncbi:hypothetical protein ACOQFB_01010 [Anaeromyxobacter sp. Red801]|uniref:hypothetical protein n=1 Tax=Anaeromyxobacter sp. Red801 TaxID=3411632 RepID=UPI003B9E9B7B
MSTMFRVLDRTTKRSIAAAAPCDRRSLDKLLAGGVVRGLAAKRARAALAAAGFAPPNEGPGGGQRKQGGRGSGGMGPRCLQVIEVLGFLPGELGGARRLFVALALLEGLDASAQVLRVLEALTELRHGAVRRLDPQHVMVEVQGASIVAGDDGRGAMLLQLAAGLTTTLAGAVLDVRAELEIDRDALRAELIGTAAAGSGAKA